jgi:hypothetical protein
MMVISACEAGLMPLEAMPGVHRGNHQDNRDAMMDTMESNFLGTCRDILKAAHHQVTSDIHSLGDSPQTKGPPIPPSGL